MVELVVIEALLVEAGDDVVEAVIDEALRGEGAVLELRDTDGEALNERVGLDDTDMIDADDVLLELVVAVDVELNVPERILVREPLYVADDDEDTQILIETALTVRVPPKDADGELDIEANACVAEETNESVFLNETLGALEALRILCVDEPEREGIDTVRKGDAEGDDAKVTDLYPVSVVLIVMESRAARVSDAGGEYDVEILGESV